MSIVIQLLFVLILSVACICLRLAIASLEVLGYVYDRADNIRKNSVDSKTLDGVSNVVGVAKNATLYATKNLLGLIRFILSTMRYGILVSTIMEVILIGILVLILVSSASSFLLLFE